jgi:heme/copper-type cytochrome/quinol oxidase subunit 3
VEHEREEVETHEQRALGFWLYLMGDAVIFALLFATYAIMIPGIAGGPTGKDLFDLDKRGDRDGAAAGFQHDLRLRQPAGEGG